MGLSIAELIAAATLNDSDVFEIEQSGVSKKIASTEMDAYLIPGTIVNPNETTLRQEGDVVSYNGTDWVTGATPRWRHVPVQAYTEAAVTSSSTITFAGGGPTAGINLKAGDYFSVGLPVRAVINDVAQYGICVAVTDTLLTINGSNLQTGIAITSLSAGTKDMVKFVRLTMDVASYQTKAPGMGGVYYWTGATGYCVGFSAAHMNTGATAQINVRTSSATFRTMLSTNLIVPAGTDTTYGAWIDAPLAAIDKTRSFVNHGEYLWIYASGAASAADYPIVCLAFVVP